ncbi:Oxidoreductase, N-terminal [Penicillium expansum]|uniref:Oxidoreductase, N-terminal n=1 Tax=Penicillium expansum TaxID=27334 RepID=A0A0A2J882_PENEN|nr:Oxidoreductase, N-terminal [Penicillium expansum]KGO44641.1 Oxidoreductase, N-terminal [Penicillium expansum]KGO51265.1 Oxidoreductase, N-terminal [Penicillium expansum]KGO51612.1 Oxidoreductase, N-terminal [Penicillium expansum]
MSTSNRILRVGIIGCGEITQVAHIPTLGFLSDYFQVTYLCDVSDNALTHCSKKVIGSTPKTTRKAEDLCASADVDIVMIANSDAFHVPHAVLGLKHDKVVFIEKPMALSLQDADQLIELEKQSSGKIMVGYMRRYASGFIDAVKEIGSLDQVCYARVRDIVGPNSDFVGQSGTFPKVFSDYREEDVKELASRTDEFLEQALTTELGIPVTADTAAQWRNLGSLGSHDLSAMREALGMPTAVLGASLCSARGPPFWSALFQYPSFAVSYESGIDYVPRFDASIEVFGSNKTVKICFDSPYVKGLPTTMHIREKLEDGSFRESVVRKTYEDAYTLEMKELYAFVVEGKPAKTTSTDAKKDLEIFGMIMKAGLEGQARLNKVVLN